MVWAEAALRVAEDAVLREETAWTSRVSELERELRAANLTIRRAEQRQTETLEGQWVRAPVAGRESDIRIAGVGVKGVDLQQVSSGLREMQF